MKGIMARMASCFGLLLLLGSPASSLLPPGHPPGQASAVASSSSSSAGGDEDDALLLFLLVSASALAERVRARLSSLSSSSSSSSLSSSSSSLSSSSSSSPLLADPLLSSSRLKYVHEGEVLRLRLLLDRLALAGLASLAVQEVSFDPEEGVQVLPPGQAVGVVRVSFARVTLRARFQVRGSAEGGGRILSFREGGDLELTAPTVFLTSRLNVTLPRVGRAKVVRVQTEASIATPSLRLKPETIPPEWARRQVQNKLEELSRDLNRGHGAVRLLLRRWDRLLKRLVHRPPK